MGKYVSGQLTFRLEKISNKQRSDERSSSDLCSVQEFD